MGQRPFPREYRILPCSVELCVPGFESVRPVSRTLAPEDADVAEWFDRFRARLVDAASENKWLPVCRMSDGEFDALWGGPRRPSRRHPPARRILMWIRNLASWLMRNGGVSAATLPGVSSGSYSGREIRLIRERLSKQFAQIGREGILALHLSYGPDPFVESFFPQIADWLAREGLRLTMDNYVPFYFVYAVLARHLGELLGGRNVGVVHGAIGEKRARITRQLLEAGASDVTWQAISIDSSAFDSVAVAEFSGCDVILVGAGIGKANIFSQLATFEGPCVDAGFMFEVWNDPGLARARIFCLPDDQRRNIRSVPR